MIKSLSVFVGPSSVIVAPRHATPDGILYEQDEPTVLVAAAARSVGAAVKKAFDAFSIRPKDLRSSKKSDWPAFRASGAKSTKQFETEFRHISIAYLNPSGAVARAETQLPSDEKFSICTSFNPLLPDEEVGALILELARRVKQFSHEPKG